MCKVMQLHPSGNYAWKAAPQSSRAEEDQRLLGLLKQAWLESGGVYGYRKLTLDTRDLGERCGKHRVARLLKTESLRLRTGYGPRPGRRGGKPAVVAPMVGVRRSASKACDLGASRCVMLLTAALSFPQPVLLVAQW